MIKRVCLTGAMLLLLQACGGSGETGETFQQEGSPQSFVPDSDGDGFPNDIDACLDTPEGASVSDSGSRQGCAEEQIPDQEDEDADSVVNIEDQCLATGAGLPVNEVGCAANQLDTDNDTINDALDVCPGTAAGATDVILDVTSEAVGCTPEQADLDGDGVNIVSDQCPGTPVGEGIDPVGCSASQKDSDGDGVFDITDVCAVTAAGATVSLEEGISGCSDAQLDRDADGVADADDQCPNSSEAAMVDVSGCAGEQMSFTDEPVIRANGRQILDASGQPLKLRGVNLQYGDNPAARLGAIPLIAEVDANAVRLQLRDNTTAEQLREALDAIVDADMVALAMFWETEEFGITCADSVPALQGVVDNRWLGDWLEVLTDERYRSHLMINIANEWGPLNVFTNDTTSYDEYISTYTAIIEDFRTAGLNVPLVIDAAHCGQDWHTFMNGRAQTLFEADSQNNIVLSAHAYNFFYDTEAEVDQAISNLNELTIPYIFGEFGNIGLSGERHLYLMAELEGHDIGWAAWSWRGNGSADTILDMNESDTEIDLSPHGEDIVNSAFGLANTSELANFPVRGTPPVFSALGSEATISGNTELRGTQAYMQGDPSTVAWSFTVPADGDYVIEIDYESDNDGRTQNVSFNGGDPEAVVFPIEASPYVRTETLTAGVENTILIEHNWGFMGLNSISVTPAAPYSETLLGTDAVVAGDTEALGTSINLREASDGATRATWTFDVPVDGIYQLSIQYVSDNDGRQQDVIVGGGDPVRTTFPIDASPSTSVHTLSAGEQTVEVRAAWGFMQIDSVTLEAIPPLFSSSLLGTDASSVGDVNTDGTSLALQAADGVPTPSITWSFYVPRAGTYNLAIDYVSDNNDRQQDVILNDNDPVRTTFPISDDPLILTETLSAGMHTLEVRAAWGFMTLEALAIEETLVINASDAALVGEAGEQYDLIGDRSVQLRAADLDPVPSLTWTFNIAETGNYDLWINYISDNDGRQQDVIIDGGDAVTTTFPIEGSPILVGDNVNLSAGSHTVEVRASWGFMTVESLVVAQGDAAPE